MIAWWNALDTLHQVFYLIAIPSTIILVLQTILLLFGLGHDSDADVDHDLDHDFDHDADHDFDHDVDHDGGVHDHSGQDADHMGGLRMLTVRGIIAFLAVCGWVGLAMLDSGMSTGISIAVSLLAGLAAMLVVAVVMRFFMRLQQSGNLDPQNAVGVTGEVYIPITEEGKGKVTLVVQERFTEMDAVCPGRALKTGQQVRVVSVTESNVLVVEPVHTGA